MGLKKEGLKLLVVSICKNESSTIEELIQRIPRNYPGIGEVEICVIDDGSTDNTAKLARQAGAHVAGGDISKGLAFRFREVIDMALERQADVLVNIDGDLQFKPEDISQFLSPITNNEADFVAANRFVDPTTKKRRRPANMPAGKYYGNKLGAWVVSHLAGKRFEDVTCGFRAYNRKALYALNLNSTHTYTQESFQIMAQKRLRIRTLPTEVTYYKGRKSRVVTSLLKYIAISGLNIMRAYRDFAPLRFFFGLGMWNFLIGLGCVSFVGYHWLVSGSFSPFKFIGFIGIYFISLAILFWIIGIMADMLVRLSGTQEKTYEDVKRLLYPKKD